mgnify:CR=1 FL=1
MYKFMFMYMCMYAMYACKCRVSERTSTTVCIAGWTGWNFCGAKLCRQWVDFPPSIQAWAIALTQKPIFAMMFTTQLPLDIRQKLMTLFPMKMLKLILEDNLFEYTVLHRLVLQKCWWWWLGFIPPTSWWGPPITGMGLVSKQIQACYR